MTPDNTIPPQGPKGTKKKFTRLIMKVPWEMSQRIHYACLVLSDREGRRVYPRDLLYPALDEYLKRLQEKERNRARILTPGL